MNSATSEIIEAKEIANTLQKERNKLALIFLLKFLTYFHHDYIEV